MPNYEYRCRDCDTRFEIHAPASAKPSHPACTHCKSNNTQAVFSPFAIGGCSKSGGIPNSCGSCSGGDCGSCR